MRVTPDTNVFISAFFWKGKPYKIIKMGYEEKLKLVVSSAIVEEVDKILRREKKFKLKKDDIKNHIKLMVSRCDLVEPTVRVNVIKEDPDDNRIIEAAVVGKAKYIISGDPHLLNLKEYKGIRIVSPAKFIKILKEK